MVSLAFHLFVVGTVIFARALPTVVVHSLVADSSLLDCCDLVVFFHLMLTLRQPFVILKWFEMFSLFSFGVSCLQPFFVCH